MDLDAFTERWSRAAAAERANKDAFLLELADVLGVERPHPATGVREADRYVFECDALLVHENEKITIGKIDLYKDGCFLLEAKQGAHENQKRTSRARRETPQWTIAMKDAYGQALGYARTFDAPPPFLVVCDIGYCFDLYATFDGSHDYRPYPNAQQNRLFLRDLGRHAELLRSVFEDPRSLDPSRRAAQVTREVAAHLAELARELEEAGHGSELVASFLMRCLFTMFAEDVALLPEKVFTQALEELWIPQPERFERDIVTLWTSMNEGREFGFVGRLLRFNGGLFADTTPLPLEKRHLERLLEAARCNWSDVEPAIFGTLLERALNPHERHALGAHYTPRAYVERLVKPTIEEPLRAEWDLVQAEARLLVNTGKVDDAVKKLRAFHDRLCEIRVLDPACGSGNFLYVALDLFKRLEGEVLSLLSELSHAPLLQEVQAKTVTPRQFLGIEIKPWAKEIAELVLWIGYLRWHFRSFGNVAPPEPVLRDYRNIERRDAVLAYDREEPLLDETTGKPVTRWDGRTMKKHPVMGEDVPDDTARLTVMRYVNPRKADWPEADFIVGNPPFVGNKRMRLALGDGYVEALRATHDDVPDTSDFVMYWWNHAAELVRAGKARRFGLITTNSITQTFNRKVVQRHLEAKVEPLSIVFAVPDHPWVDSEDGAAVRIAMTAVAPEPGDGTLALVGAEYSTTDDHSSVGLTIRAGRINANLTVGTDVARATRLRANFGLGFMGVTIIGEGFILPAEEAQAFLAAHPDETPVVRDFINGRDVMQIPRHARVIDFFGRSEDEARTTFPNAYAILAERVLPVRRENPRGVYRENWWLFGETRPAMRAALTGLDVYIATCRTAKHRVFLTVPGTTLPESKVAAIALSDRYVLGVLSSRIHCEWAVRAGAFLGVGNDSNYNHSSCFDPFPFPVPSDIQRGRIRTLGEQLDSHRKRQQQLHPELTITGIYNVLEKLRGNGRLNAKEHRIHEQALVSVLKQIHDDLDAAVFEAYGWPATLTDEEILERLVKLNGGRAAEEARGLVRWLRPEFQNPSGAATETQVSLPHAEVAAAATRKAKKPAWPGKLPERIAAVRDLVQRSDHAWSVAEVAASFTKVKQAADVEAVLDSLAALGLLAAYDAAEGRRWRAASRLAA